METFGFDLLEKVKKANRQKKTARDPLVPSSLGRTPRRRLQDLTIRFGRPAFAARLAARWRAEKRLAPLCAGMCGTRFSAGGAAWNRGVDFGRDDLMFGRREKPRCLFGRALVARREVGALARSQDVQDAPHTFSGEEVAILGPGELVRTHRAALHEKIGLGNVVE